MKVTRLNIGFEYDFDLFGVSSSLKDYKLAWHINNELKISLQRGDDYVLEFNNGKSIAVSFYQYESENCVIKMLKNRSLIETQTTDFLVPELKHFDYFVLKEGLFMENEEFINALRKVKGVEYSVEVDIDKLKSKENLIL